MVERERWRSGGLDGHRSGYIEIGGHVTLVGKVADVLGVADPGRAIRPAAPSRLGAVAGGIRARPRYRTVA